MYKCVKIQNGDKPRYAYVSMENTNENELEGYFAEEFEADAMNVEVKNWWNQGLRMVGFGGWTLSYMKRVR